jgi:DNA-binding transcriptional ArsR family regulator
MSKRSLERGVAGAAMVFAALGDETRLSLLRRLAQDGPASITTLAADVDLSRQGVTKHLQVLASAGVIDGRRSGREHLWAMNPDRLAQAMRHIETISRGWDSALARLKAQVENHG